MQLLAQRTQDDLPQLRLIQGRIEGLRVALGVLGDAHKELYS